MPRAPIVVLSNIIIDDVWTADGLNQGRSIGGAAVWAAVGARAWWPQVAIAAGVGADLAAVSGGQLRKFDLCADGELVRDAHTIQSRLVYSADGTRTETPAFGHEHFQHMQLIPADIPATLVPAAGTYLFRGLWPAFWQSFASRRSHLGHTLWELQGDLAVSHLWPQVRALLPLVDIVSLNQAEGSGLLGSTDPRFIARQLLEGGARTVVVRMGADGALAATATQALQVTPPRAPVVDVTGGGNSFCGGFLAGWCDRPGDLEYAARHAAASAALCIAQVGLPATDELSAAPSLAAAAGVTPLHLPARAR